MVTTSKTTRTKLAAADVTRNCIAVRLRMANRIITKIYDDALRPFGLKVTQLSMLALAENRGLIRQADVCAELQLDDSTLSRNLERMRANKWLEEVEGENAREHPYRLTAKGRKLLNEVIPVWSTAQDRARQLLGDSGVEALCSFAKETGFCG